MEGARKPVKKAGPMNHNTPSCRLLESSPSRRLLESSPSNRLLESSSSEEEPFYTPMNSIYDMMKVIDQEIHQIEKHSVHEDDVTPLVSLINDDFILKLTETSMGNNVTIIQPLSNDSNEVEKPQTPPQSSSLVSVEKDASHKDDELNCDNWLIVEDGVGEECLKYDSFGWCSKEGNLRECLKDDNLGECSKDYNLEKRLKDESLGECSKDDNLEKCLKDESVGEGSRDDSSGEHCVDFGDAISESDSREKICGRSQCSKQLCDLVRRGSEFFERIRQNEAINRFWSRAKESMDNFTNLIEVKIYQILNTQEYIKFIMILDQDHMQSVTDAFINASGGRVSVSAFGMKVDSLPVLPVTMESGIRSAERKMSIARKDNLAGKDDIIVATSDVVFNVCDTWHLATVICLHDPNYNLTLQNFSASVPVPKQYIIKAQDQTPRAYMSEKSGFAVDLRESIGAFWGIKCEKAREFLTGECNRDALYSSAMLLAAMHKQVATYM